MYDVGKCLLSDKLLESRMTQQDLANKLGVTKQQINTYAANNRLMSLPIAKNIATVLNCEIGELYDWIPVDKRTKRR